MWGGCFSCFFIFGIFVGRSIFFPFVWVVCPEHQRTRAPKDKTIKKHSETMEHNQAKHGKTMPPPEEFTLNFGETPPQWPLNIVIASFAYLQKGSGFIFFQFNKTSMVRTCSFSSHIFRNLCLSMPFTKFHPGKKSA